MVKVEHVRPPLAIVIGWELFKLAARRDFKEEWEVSNGLWVHHQKKLVSSLRKGVEKSFLMQFESQTHIGLWPIRHVQEMDC